MVWNTTQSAFYKAIDNFNSKDGKGDDQQPFCDDSECEKNNESIVGECVKTECEKHSRKNEKNRPERRLCCEHCPGRRNLPITDIFSDKDKLLIAGLIMILSQQNADRKLIMALMFIMLT